ncbi:MAG: galactose mutarotase [Clostridia bacterium]|nr:galactose mutarotase [Clostridia bacterium]MBR2389136.1 galactose mutarotase [Clostridia bacterium]
MGISKVFFGKLSDGRSVTEYTLENKNGVKVKLLDYGATVKEIHVPDRNGNFADVVAGYDSLDSYVNADGYQGAVIGRVGNRICKGKFTLDGKDYSLFINNGPNHLHGGEFGFNSKVWDVDTVGEDEPSIIFSYISPDGEEGYPGTLKVSVKYTLSSDNALSINYVASTDKKTIVNLTNHSYFNLGGYDSESIHSHELFLDAEYYLPTDDTLIPTGEIKSVKGTPFDFTTSKEIGRDILSNNQDLIFARGYDHCFYFGESENIVKRAELYDKNSGRVMEMFTDQPAVHIYTGNYVNNEEYPFKGGVAQEEQTLVCLETEKMPDSINHDNFTNVILEPSEVYDYTTIFKFSVK